MIVQQKVDLSRLTSIRIGGNAEIYYEPESKEELVELLTEISKQQPVILGGGTNVVFGERLTRPVVHIGRGLRYFEFLQAESKVNIKVGAGMLLPAMVKKTVANGYQGLEVCAGIPGTIGGGVIMNAGTSLGEIGSVVTYVEVFDMNELVVKRLSADMIDFGYRQTSLMNMPICVLEVGLLLKEGDPVALKNTVHTKLGSRSSRKVKGRNCGSIFKNPPGDKAGRLIEVAGLKGHRIGDLKVSEDHANYFVNINKASYNDFIELTSIVKQTVLEKSSVRLDLEARIIT